MPRTLLLLLAACTGPADKPAPPDSAPVDDRADADLDGYPDAEDCAPDNAAISPGATELCDGQDNDCDGATDEGLGSSFYPDADGDGFGQDGAPLTACEKPQGYVPNDGDCDDSDAGIAPGQAERCDGVDQDCDGDVDEDLGQPWYQDADGDGWGNEATETLACAAPTGFVATPGDCDDEDATASPEGEERCGGGDEDCDGTVDEDEATDALTVYQDIDGDGYGDALAPLTTCAPPAATTADASDCDDRDAAIFPGADEWCDGDDNDCDGTVDEDEALDALPWYTDDDGDGHGQDGTLTLACEAPSGSAAVDGDCDDGDAGVYPGASETCDAVDEDCDGTIDDGVLGTGAACPAVDCAEVLADNPTARDGSYVLDLGTYTCDMSTDGGGWTLVKASALVSGTTADTTAYNTEGFTWDEVLFAYNSGSVFAHCTYPTDLPGCLNLGFRFGSESWGVPAAFGSTICGLGTVDYSAATSHPNATDFIITRSSSTDTVALAVLEAVSSCTTWDNSGTAAVDVLLRR